MSPLLGFCSPAINFSIVDFPAPFFPAKPILSLGLTKNLYFQKVQSHQMLPLRCLLRSFYFLFVWLTILAILYNILAPTFASHSSAPGEISLMSNAIIFSWLHYFSIRYKISSVSKPPETGVPVLGHNLGSKPSISKLK